MKKDEDQVAQQEASEDRAIDGFCKLSHILRLFGSSERAIAACSGMQGSLTYWQETAEV